MKPSRFREEYPNESKSMDGVCNAQLDWIKKINDIPKEMKWDIYRSVRSCLRETWVNGYFHAKNIYERKRAEKT